MSRGVWDYAQDCTVAEAYDAELTDTPLLEADLRFASTALSGGRTLIDLGCGTGRAAIHFAERGHRVLGVDLSLPMLRVARDKATAAGRAIDFACGSITDLAFVRDAAFDSAICLFSTLGMVAGAAARAAAMSEFFRVLRPGGTLVVHVHLLVHHLRTRAGRRLFVRDAVRRGFRHEDAGDFPMPARPGSPAWVMHLFTRREISRLLRGAGFLIERERAIGINGRPTRICPYGLMVAARRPGR